MGKWTDYPSKGTPADNDTLMLYDATAKANKQSPFSGVWNWIVGKLTNAVISNLQTSNKTVVGALNELNSKSSSYWVYNKNDDILEITFSQRADGGMMFGKYKTVLLRADATGIRLSGFNNSNENWEVVWKK